MKRGFVSFFMIICVAICSLGADTPAQPSDLNWLDITDKVYASAANNPGWTQDAKGKVFRDETQMFLKIITADFGNFKIDLKNQKVYELKADGVQSEIADSSILQRDHGMTFVMKTPKVKIRGMIKEKLEGMKGISGIKGVM